MTNEGTDVLFGVSVGSDVCSLAAYGVGDADGDQRFDPGETWVFACVRTYGAPNEYTETSTAMATNTQTGLAVVSGTAVGLLSVTGDGGGGASGGGALLPRISLSESTSASSGGGAADRGTSLHLDQRRRRCALRRIGDIGFVLPGHVPGRRRRPR